MGSVVTGSPYADGVIRRFFTGVGMLVRGFGFWARRPGAMALGLIPAAIVAIVVGAALVALGFNMPFLTDWLTPFADEWTDPWPDLLRGAIVEQRDGLVRRHHRSPELPEEARNLRIGDIPGIGELREAHDTAENILHGLIARHRLTQGFAR